MAKRPAGQPIRVLVAEDSRAQRELLVGLLRGAGMAIVGTASDGPEAVAATQRLRPDVLAMDINMPGLDGFEATRQIMQRCPTPIVLISSADDAATRTIAALAAGALAVIRKPGGGDSPEQASERTAFLTTVRLMADVLVVTRRPGRALAGDAMPAQALAVNETRAQAGAAAAGVSTPQILAIAASTGGPAALQIVLSGLGASFPLPILVAQHIASGFVGPLAEWLQSTTGLPVGIARSNELLQPGRVYLAPENQHLGVFVRSYIANRPTSAEEIYCPSADVLFRAVAAAYGRDAIGVILTGMGSDGARGLQALRTVGGRTLAQDEASCVVYGMPRAAVELGAVERVAPLAALAQVIRSLAAS
jgi:two-component system chemotaxis response regulator CheB